MLARKLLFDRIYNDYYGSLLNVIRQNIPDRDLAQDLLQDAFIKIWIALPDYDPVRGGLYTWMATICTHIALDEIRSKHYWKDSLTDQLDQRHCHYNQGNQFVINVDKMDVYTQLEKLRTSYYKPLLLYSLGYTHIEISKQLKIPLGTVKSRIRIGLLILRKIWQS